MQQVVRLHVRGKTIHSFTSSGTFTIPSKVYFQLRHTCCCWWWWWKPCWRGGGGGGGVGESVNLQINH